MDSINRDSFVVVTDSQSALMAIEIFNSRHPIVMEIQEWLYCLHSKHKAIQFCWSPSHIGISLNEVADINAKAAVRYLPVSNQNLPFTII